MAMTIFFLCEMFRKCTPYGLKDLSILCHSVSQKKCNKFIFLSLEYSKNNELSFLLIFTLTLPTRTEKNFYACHQWFFCSQWQYNNTFIWDIFNFILILTKILTSLLFTTFIYHPPPPKKKEGDNKRHTLV